MPLRSHFADIEFSLEFFWWIFDFFGVFLSLVECHHAIEFDHFSYFFIGVGVGEFFKVKFDIEYILFVFDDFFEIVEVVVYLFAENEEEVGVVDGQFGDDVDVGDYVFEDKDVVVSFV